MLQPKVIEVKPIKNYKLLLTFANGERRIFDVSQYISGDWYGKLKDPEFFATVQVSGNTVAWKDGQDIAPHELYEMSVSIEKLT